MERFIPPQEPEKRRWPLWRKGLAGLTVLTLITGALNATTGIPVNLKGARVRFGVKGGLIMRYESECLPKPRYAGGTAYYARTTVLWDFQELPITPEQDEVEILNGISWTSCWFAGRE